MNNYVNNAFLVMNLIQIKFVNRWLINKIKEGEVAMADNNMIISRIQILI